MRKTCLNLIYELAKANSRVFFIGSDLGAGTLNSFKCDIPDRFFMEGISEANILGMATGLALDGKIVYINTIASFLTRRCYEQLVVDLCLHNVNVRLIGNGGGLVYGPLGPTHQAIEDFAITRVIPNLTVIAPADENEMKNLMPKTIEHKGPIYIRLAKGYDPIVTTELDNFEIGRAYAMRSGNDASIFTTGIMLQYALAAADQLSELSIDVSVVHVPTLKPLDNNTIRDYLMNVNVIVTLEEHLVTGGLGTAIAELIAENPNCGIRKFKKLGIPDTFNYFYGSQQEIMENYQMTTTDVVNAILKYD